jgi:hypothetical protein
MQSKSPCKPVLLIVILISTLLLVSCDFPNLISTSSFDSEEVIAQKETIAMRMTETIGAESASTSTPLPATITPTSDVQCAYVWTLKQDDELSLLFSDALDSSIKKAAALGVVWYGENCINTESNGLVKFYAANLDITIMFETEEEFTKQWMGDHILSVMNSVEGVLKQRTDLASYPIKLHFVYTVDGKYAYLDFDLASYRKINEETQRTGEDLYNALAQ